jgi:hypothetical protein
MQMVAYASVLGTALLLAIGVLFQRWKIDEDEEETILTCS